MSEYAYFYNSENGDRVYDADSFSNWLKKFFTTGVFEDDCQVTALGSMVVNLAPGYANIMGKVKELENQTFTLEPADGQYPRIDTIVIERNDTDRDITAKVVTGQLSGNNPIPTPRVWENGVYQLIVAEVYVAAGATEVTQANITDKRSDPDVCGIVAGTVTEMDFSQFTAQFEAYFAEFQESNLDEFDEWFQHMKDQLDTDAAGHLQNEIDGINAKIPSGASSSNKLATEDEITTINDNLSGFKFYPAGTGIVGLIADDSAYTDANDKYVIWGTPTAEQLVEDNPNTYKSVPSEEDARGKEGEDTAMSFGGKSGHYDGELVICGKLGTSSNQVAVSYFETPYSMPSGFLANTAGEAGTLQTPTVTIMIAAQEYGYNSRFKAIAKRKGKFHLYGTSKGLDDVVVDAEIGDVIIQDVWVGTNVQATIDNPNYYLLQDKLNNIMYDALVIRYEET